MNEIKIHLIEWLYNLIYHLFVSSFDALQIRDGDSANATILDILTGTTVPLNESYIISTGSCLHLEFTSDDGTALSGFIIQYEAGKPCDIISLLNIILQFT